jgi:hypothetical protein
VYGKPDPWYDANRERAEKAAPRLPGGWAGTHSDAAIVRDVLGVIREYRTHDACELALRCLSQGKVEAGGIWDAVHLAAAELLMRKANVGHPLHANTSANALHHAFRSASVPEDRLVILLQAISWQCQARRRMAEQARTDPKWTLTDTRITDLRENEKLERPDHAVDEILATLSSRPEQAAQKLFTLAKDGAAGLTFRQNARRVLLLKIPDADIHHVKYPVSIFEDAARVTRIWRPHLLASSVYWLPGSDRRDSEVVQSAREALKRP